ncbi:MAG: DUF2062 domain-containing protein [Pseudomonadota bacterium]
MIFKRREKALLSNRLREAVAPRKGFWRGIDYIGKRMRRLPDSPHRIALGFACGALASFSPFFGFHFFLAAGLAWLVRGNVLAGLFGTIVGNPITFPFISAASLGMGRWLLGQNDDGSGIEVVGDAFAEAFSSIWATMKSWFGYGPSMMDGLVKFFHDVFLPYLIGGILPGLFCAVACYWLIGPIVAAYQERRRKKLQIIQERRRAELDKELSAYQAHDGMEGDHA